MQRLALRVDGGHALVGLGDGVGKAHELLVGKGVANGNRG